MLKLKAAFSSKTGKLLEMKTAMFGGVTPEIAVEAAGDVVVRLVHHIVAVHGDSVDPSELIAKILGKAYAAYPTLPEITAEMHESVKKDNDAPDPEPEFRDMPSGDDRQIMTCALVLRVNGFQVYRGGANTEPVHFDEIPAVAAGMLGTLAADGLTSMTAPACIDEHAELSLNVFEESFSATLPFGLDRREAMAAAVHRRRMTKFINGELKEEN